jgi:hypothetical protein
MGLNPTHELTTMTILTILEETGDGRRYMDSGRGQGKIQ